MSSKISINILYLCRATSDETFTTMCINRFIETYKKQVYSSTHYQVTLSILLKSHHLLPQLSELTDSIQNCTIYPIPDYGFDLGSYLDFSKNCDSDFIMPMSFTSFFSYSYSLCCFLDLIQERPQLNLIFSQFSCTSYKKKPRYALKLLLKVGLIASLKYILLSFIYSIKYFSFPPFPNYHFRTTGFLINRLLYCSYFDNIAYPVTRFDCLNIESGRYSLFKFCIMHSSTSPCWLLSSSAHPIEHSDLELLVSNISSSQLLVHDHRSFSKESLSDKEALRLALSTIQYK